MIAIAFALPDESRELARALKSASRAGSAEFPALLGNLGTQEVLIFHTGMGVARVRERLPALFAQFDVTAVISAGYAGGLDPCLPTGALILAGNYSNLAMMAKATATLQKRCLVQQMATSPRVLETTKARAEFAELTGAAAVDMETCAIAEICHANGVPLLALRVITDGANEELAVPFSVCFDAEKERPRIGALLGFLFRNPSRVKGFIQFVRTVNQARKTLTGALVELIGQFQNQPAGEPAKAQSVFGAFDTPQLQTPLAVPSPTSLRV